MCLTTFTDWLRLHFSIGFVPVQKLTLLNELRMEIKVLSSIDSQHNRLHERLQTGRG